MNRELFSLYSSFGLMTTQRRLHEWISRLDDITTTDSSLALVRVLNEHVKVGLSISTPVTLTSVNQPYFLTLREISLLPAGSLIEDSVGLQYFSNLRCRLGAKVCELDERALVNGYEQLWFANAQATCQQLYLLLEKRYQKLFLYAL